MKNIGMKKFGTKKIIMKTTFTPIAALLIFLSISATPAYAAVAGRVLVSVGDSVAIRNGQEVRLHFGSQIEDKDTLRTGAAGSLQVRFTDRSIVALREKSTFKLEQYAYSKEKGGVQTAIFNLIKGGFRTITGLIGKSNQKSYSVKTAAATIGIRGTHYALRICEDDCKNPDGSNAKDGVYGSVLSASDKDSHITVNNETGEKEFGRDEHFYVKDEKAAPQTLLVPPSFVADNLKGRGQIAEKNTQDDGKDVDRKSGTHKDSRPDMIARIFESKVAVTDPNCTTGDCRNLPPPPLGRGSVVVTGKVGHMAGLTTGGQFTTGLISRGDQLTLQPTGELIKVAQGISGNQIAGSRVLDIGSAHNIGTGRDAVAGNLAWGAWIGTGITDQSTSIDGAFTKPLGSFVYIYGDAAGALPNRITATYQRIGGVAVDLKGNTGTITSGNIGVNFLAQLVSLNSLVVDMGDRSFTYSSSPISNILIAQNGSFSDSGPAACTGCIDAQTTFSAGGAFTGADAQGIGLHYDLVNINDQITGVEGFLRTDYKPVTSGVLTAYAGSGTALYSVADNDAISLSTERTLEGGNLVAYSTALGDSASNGTALPLDIGTGIGGPAGDHFGRWDGGSITGNSVADASLPTPPLTPASGVHYLYTAALTLPEVIAARTGTTVNFNHAGGTLPTDHLGNVGTFGTGSNLSVSFDAHTALMNANWAVGTNNYSLGGATLNLVVDGNGASIIASLANDAGSFCTACSLDSTLQATIDQVNIQGNFSGAAGNTINMAISTFDAGAAAAPVTSASVQVFQEGLPPPPPVDATLVGCSRQAVHICSLLFYWLLRLLKRFSKKLPVISKK